MLQANQRSLNGFTITTAFKAQFGPAVNTNHLPENVRQVEVWGPKTPFSMKLEGLHIISYKLKKRIKFYFIVV